MKSVMSFLHYPTQTTRHRNGRPFLFLLIGFVIVIIYLTLTLRPSKVLINDAIDDQSNKPVGSGNLLIAQEKVKIVRIHPSTDWSKSLEKTNQEFFDSHKPDYICPKELLIRTGKDHDGGKWLCGLKTLAQRTIQNGHNCSVYSFGVAGESSFEAEILATTFCTVYAYDPTGNEIGAPLKPNNPRIHFQAIGVSGKRSFKSLFGFNSFPTKTIKMFMEENGSSFIDILKMDVETAEFAALERMLEDFDEVPFGQLVVEIHILSWSAYQRDRAVKIFEGLEKKGARLFSVEKNEFYPDNAAEYSFINVNKLDLFVKP